MSVTYVNDGDLATPENVNAWLNRAAGEVFNVKAFDAKGDGSTDDTTAIQAAIDACNSADTGGVVYFPPGTYMVSQLTWPNGVNLVGCGTKKNAGSAIVGSNLKQISGTNDDMIVSASAIDGSWMESASIRYMRFTGAPGATAGSGLKMNARTGEAWRLESTWFEDFAEHGVELARGFQPMYIEDIHLYRNGGSGLYITREATDLMQSGLINMISGDSNKDALLRVVLGDNSGTTGSGLTVLNLKSEVGVAGTQQNSVILDNMQGMVVVMIGAQTILTGDATSANSIVQINTSAARLHYMGFSADTGVSFYVDDNVNSQNITAHASKHSGIVGAANVPLFSDGTRGDAGIAGRVIFNTTDGNLNIDDGTNWILPDGTTT